MLSTHLEQVKPRLWRSGDCWFCRLGGKNDTGIAGAGLSPLEAYEHWCDRMISACVNLKEVVLCNT